jgi:hypothetical protein
MEQRNLADKREFVADLTNEADGANRIVLRNVVGNGLEIAHWRRCPREWNPIR